MGSVTGDSATNVYATRVTTMWRDMNAGTRLASSPDLKRGQRRHVHARRTPEKDAHGKESVVLRHAHATQTGTATTSQTR